MTAAIAPSVFVQPLPSLVASPTLLNLLIVDDDRTVRDACREAASTLGYRTSGAESAEQAIRAFESQNIDVVLLELKQPGAGGLEALQQMKSLRPDVEVIIVTGHATVHALLLCCGIALREPALTESVATRLRTIEEVANQIKNKLATSEDNERAFAART